jgi:hypothetical protein
MQPGIMTNITRGNDITRLIRQTKLELLSPKMIILYVCNPYDTE